MKLKIITFLILLLSFISCNQPKTNRGQILSVTIEPQKYFLEKLVGDKYTVNCVVPIGANPETFDPVPSQLISISKSKAFFIIGSLGVEKTLISKIKENNQNISFIDCSEGITLIEADHHCTDSMSSHHDGDPHIWSSPATAKVIVKNMYNALIDIDKPNEAYYKANYDKIIVTIDSTDTVIKDYLSQTSQRDFIIYHPALSYYAQEYGLEQYVIEQDGKNPTPKQLANLIDTAKEKNIKTIFIQQEYDMKNAETIAKAIEANMIPINLLNYDWNEEMVNIAKAFTHE